MDRRYFPVQQHLPRHYSPVRCNSNMQMPRCRLPSVRRSRSGMCAVSCAVDRPARAHKCSSAFRADDVQQRRTPSTHQHQCRTAYSELAPSPDPATCCPPAHPLAVLKPAVVVVTVRRDHDPPRAQPPTFTALRLSDTLPRYISAPSELGVLRPALQESSITTT
jgi:hypothetical protein